MEYVRKEGEFVPDKLFAGIEIPALVGVAKIQKGAGIIERGTVLAKGTDENFYILGSSEATSASAVPYGVMTDTIEVGDEDVNTTVYLSGIFNRDALIVAEDADISEYEYELRKISIYLRTVED